MHIQICNFISILFILFIFNQRCTHCYSAVFEIGVERFVVLNTSAISNGDCCDSKHANGAYNACDLRFQLERCQKDSLDYECVEVFNYKAEENTDSVTYYDQSGSVPSSVIQLNRGFPKVLLLNLTVYDVDGGVWSGDDYIGTYRLFLSANDLSVTQRSSVRQSSYITRPGHSEFLLNFTDKLFSFNLRLVLWYQGYCLDVDCQNNKFRQIFQSSFGGPHGGIGVSHVNTIIPPRISRPVIITELPVEIRQKTGNYYKSNNFRFQLHPGQARLNSNQPFNS